MTSRKRRYSRVCFACFRPAKLFHPISMCHSMSHPFMRTSTNNSKLFDSFIITIWSNSQCNQWKYHFLTFRWNPFSIIFYQMGASIFHPINAGCDRERWIILSTGMEIFIEKGKKENLVVINYLSPAHRSVGRWERNRKAEAVEKYNNISVVVPIMLYLCGAHRHTQTHKWALNWGKREREKKTEWKRNGFSSALHTSSSVHKIIFILMMFG